MQLLIGLPAGRTATRRNVDCGHRVFHDARGRHGPDCRPRRWTPSPPNHRFETLFFSESYALGFCSSRMPSIRARTSSFVFGCVRM
jgi:hypothetical protein